MSKSLIELDGKMETNELLNALKHDPGYETTEEEYKEMRWNILGDSDDEKRSDNEEESDDKITIDKLETNLLSFRTEVYFTIQSSLTVNECSHRLLKGEIKLG